MRRRGGRDGWTRLPVAELKSSFCTSVRSPARNRSSRRAMCAAALASRCATAGRSFGAWCSASAPARIRVRIMKVRARITEVRVPVMKKRVRFMKVRVWIMRIGFRV
jgi:hypothetical protein